MKMNEAVWDISGLRIDLRDKDRHLNFSYTVNAVIRKNICLVML